MLGSSSTLHAHLAILLEPVKNRMPKPLSVNLLRDPEHWRGFVRTAKAPIRAVDGIYISIKPFHPFCDFDETGFSLQ
jgi:hypothetical protein